MVIKHPLPGSERKVAQGTTVIGQCDPAERIEVFVMLRRQQQAKFDALIKRIEAGDASVKPLSREALAQDYGAAPDDIAKVRAFAAAHGLTVAREDPAARSVLLSGTIAQFQSAFEVKLELYQHHAAGQFRGRTGSISVPDDLHGVVEAVLGLDNRPQARPHFRIRPPFVPARAGQTSYSPPQLASLYKFPQGDGGGQCVGIIELGGGYNTSDLKTYFSSLGVSEPTVIPVGVDQAGNEPSGDPNGPDGEVTLDIEIVGAIVPAASIAVYFTQNSDAGFIDAVSRAVHDTTNKPSVISISWGAPESVWTSQSMQALNSVLQSAAALGVTICAASGDSGSSDGSAGGDAVDFPASSPYVLACGGTHLSASGSAITREVVWNDGEQGGATGGGVSSAFPVPAWQQGLSATATGGGSQPLGGRGVPDVAGDASPLSGYDVLVDGMQTVVGGTSAVAPLWAALIARINAAKGQPAGFVNARLYKAPGVCNDITQGNNGSFTASKGWDACTGLGSPNGGKVAGAL
ncbi:MULTISPECIES: protease pro-enzyme activation domain-containing protein [unclassified Paraburkholderia]|uniref:S53 family peptidase n=1 Tax=unclassified Paraburkholderia TaxID=2615204 RepID=UPI00161A37A2|nr:MULTISPECIES: S53 family peptidase [unclassified Paraburkholderia]MBB5445383.1 kumamolisin [Paraburkholderia sp. WSM4177]MBB5486137.1 kumamolisin [Paraburkholderia sp. WSM4180]